MVFAAPIHDGRSTARTWSVRRLCQRRHLRLIHPHCQKSGAHTHGFRQRRRPSPTRCHGHPQGRRPPWPRRARSIQTPALRPAGCHLQPAPRCATPAVLSRVHGPPKHEFCDAPDMVHKDLRAALWFRMQPSAAPAQASSCLALESTQ